MLAKKKKRMFKGKSKSIIAMKGYPFTRKTEFADYIATSLQCPAFYLDDALDILGPNHCRDRAFQMLCEMAKSNLSEGCAQHIVIDSPLSSRSQLDQLVEVASSADQTRLVIVECKSDNIYKWQTTFEEYVERNHPDETADKWYKAKCWGDLEKAMRDGYDHRSDTNYRVSTLVVDPLSFPGDTLSAPGSRQLTYFIGLVKYMIMHNPELVVYDLWRRGHYLWSSSSIDFISGMDGPEKSGSCRAGSGHYITNYVDALGVEYKGKPCSACERHLVKGAAAYTCTECCFALHKECAELLDGANSKQSLARPPNDLNRLLRNGCRDVFGELLFRCRWCEVEEDTLNSTDSSCKDCLFTTHLKSRLMPTVIRHDCHQHFLSVELSELNPCGEYSDCNGCGFRILESICYSCKICGVAYHSECLTGAPVRVEHEHGGHRHHMLIQYSSEEAEDYLCYVCFERELPERRDPNCWFYSCQDCHYVAHLTCITDRWDFTSENPASKT